MDQTPRRIVSPIDYAALGLTVSPVPEVVNTIETLRDGVIDYLRKSRNKDEKKALLKALSYLDVAVTAFHESRGLAAAQEQPAGCAIQWPPSVIWKQPEGTTVPPKSATESEIVLRAMQEAYRKWKINPQNPQHGGD